MSCILCWRSTEGEVMGEIECRPNNTHVQQEEEHHEEEEEEGVQWEESGAVEGRGGGAGGGDGITEGVAERRDRGVATPSGSQRTLFFEWRQITHHPFDLR